MTRVLGFLLLAASAAWGARGSSSYSVDPEALDSGGGRQASASYTVESSVGLVAGFASSSSYALWSGWTPTEPPVAPSGGTLSISPEGPAAAGSVWELRFTGWTGEDPPLRYSVEIDGVEVSPPGPAEERSVPVPTGTGSYRLTGRIADAGGGSTVVKRVVMVVTPREAWRHGYFGTTQNLGVAADDFDFDGDGRVNGAEWALGADPTRRDAVPLRVYPPAGGVFQVEYRRRADAVGEGFGFRVEWSDGDFAGAWSDAGVQSLVIGGIEDGMRTVWALVPQGAAGRRFARLEVIPPGS